MSVPTSSAVVRRLDIEPHFAGGDIGGDCGVDRGDGRDIRLDHHVRGQRKIDKVGVSQRRGVKSADRGRRALRVQGCRNAGKQQRAGDKISHRMRRFGHIPPSVRRCAAKLPISLRLRDASLNHPLTDKAFAPLWVRR
jgi:hypothetical protein